MKRLALLLPILALGLWFASRALNPSLVVRAAEPLTASGTIEATQVRVSAQIGGRILELLADEGDTVQAGQVLARLDDALLRAELKKAQAALVAAQAQLAQARAGARPEDVRQAEAAVKLARAIRDGARLAWQDAQVARDQPQELDLKIATARTQLAIAEARLAQALAATDAAQAEHDLWAQVYDTVREPFTTCVTVPFYGTLCREISFSSQRIENASFQWNVATQKLTSAWDAVKLATAARDAAKVNLEGLLAQRANPQTLNAQVDAAKAQYESAEAALKEAEAALALARAGASREQIEMAEKSVQQAESAVRALEVQLDQMIIRAPISGLVIARSVNEGEMAIPSVALFTLANLDHVELNLYIPETQIARVKVGQRVLVSVDSFPNRTFEGRVTYIASQAEFTPRTVQTKEERAKMVFAVRVTIPNPDYALKPGMPADAVIQEAQ
ncbi:MAG: efflux RND transporter periplasmic adaptor subunit [Anaerolineae bacterium]|nr:efflux RND transporter periplasmic adaptor subunit [Anaerolineae bacterium]